MSLNLVRTGRKPEGAPSEQAVRNELSHLLESLIFVQSQRLARFLRFTVETALAGQSEILKEYLIGTEVYDRKPPYHPSTDSIVRSEARRLRSKLKQYYESVGKSDPVFIYYRPGSYVPVFRLQRGEDRGNMETVRAFGNVLAEGLFAEALEARSGVQELDVQIVFEGKVRIVRPGSPACAAPDLRLIPKTAKRNRTSKPV